MEAMIQQLKQMVIDQIAYVENLNEECDNIKRLPFTEERCDSLMKTNDKANEEFRRLRHMRHALVSLREAAGHKGIDEFYPELF